MKSKNELEALDRIADLLERLLNEGITLNKPSEDKLQEVKPSTTTTQNKADEALKAFEACAGFKCPLCGSDMASRYNSRTDSYFCGCTKYPACKGTRDVDGKVTKSKVKFEFSNPAIDDRSYDDNDYYRDRNDEPPF